MNPSSDSAAHPDPILPFVVETYSMDVSDGICLIRQNPDSKQSYSNVVLGGAVVAAIGIFLAIAMNGSQRFLGALLAVISLIISATFAAFQPIKGEDYVLYEDPQAYRTWEAKDLVRSQAHAISARSIKYISIAWTKGDELGLQLEVHFVPGSFHESIVLLGMLRDPVFARATARGDPCVRRAPPASISSLLKTGHVL